MRTRHGRIPSVLRDKGSLKKTRTSEKLPFVGLQIEFAVQLTHGDGLGVENVAVDRPEGLAAGLGLALEGSHGGLEYLVALDKHASCIIT